MSVLLSGDQSHMVPKPPTSQRNILSRMAGLAYGVMCYGICVITMLYACGFLANVVMPRSIDSIPVALLENALLVDATLWGLFSLKHRGMASQDLKQKWRYYQAYTDLTFVTPLSGHPPSAICGLDAGILGHTNHDSGPSGLCVGNDGVMVGAIQLEERDLPEVYGDVYRTYCRQVPMLIPCWRR